MHKAALSDYFTVIAMRVAFQQSPPPLNQPVATSTMTPGLQAASRWIFNTALALGLTLGRTPVHN